MVKKGKVFFQLLTGSLWSFQNGYKNFSKYSGAHKWSRDLSFFVCKMTYLILILACKLMIFQKTYENLYCYFSTCEH